MDYGLVLFGDIGLTFLGFLLFGVSLFMMMLILVQRGKGGGLTGALGGMGGQSAFGSKAGDVFTRITVGTAVFWILLCILTIQFYNRPPSSGDLTAKEVPSFESTDEDEEGGMSASDNSEDVTEGEGSSDADDPENLEKELEGFLSDEDQGTEESAEEGSTESEDSGDSSADPAENADENSGNDSGENN